MIGSMLIKFQVYDIGKILLKQTKKILVGFLKKKLILNHLVFLGKLNICVDEASG